MKRIAARLLAITAFCLSTPVLAETAVVTNIDRIFPANTGIIDIVPTTQSSACTNTTTPKRYRMQVGVSGMTADGMRQLYAAILYAASTGKAVTLYFDETSASCNITRVLIEE